MYVVFPTAKCRLRLLKLERIKDFLLLEKEYIRNQEVFKVGWLIFGVSTLNY